MTASAEQSKPLFAARRIIIGVGGGIAAYKMATVVSRLVQADADVTVLMTESATRFVTPLTFQALSGRTVYTSQWEHIESKDPQHIALARSADAVLIAPATMNLIAKIAHGFSNDVVTLVLSAIDPRKTPILIAPSMNAVMLDQASTKRNLGQLSNDGFQIIEPADGWQACRTSGRGRLPEPGTLIDALARAIHADGSEA